MRFLASFALGSPLVRSTRIKSVVYLSNFVQNFSTAIALLVAVQVVEWRLFRSDSVTMLSSFLIQQGSFTVYREVTHISFILLCLLTSFLLCSPTRTPTPLTLVGDGSLTQLFCEDCRKGFLGFGCECRTSLAQTPHERFLGTICISSVSRPPQVCPNHGPLLALCLSFPTATQDTVE